MKQNHLCLSLFFFVPIEYHFDKKKKKLIEVLIGFAIINFFLKLVFSFINLVFNKHLILHDNL